jgi:uncharacterized repeat protein (TIGR03803 family)
MSSIHLTRRAIVAAPLLGAGLAAAGLAEAKKPSFQVIFNFPIGEAPVNHPLNSGDGHGQTNRLNIITASKGWRLNYNTGFANDNDALRLHSPTCSHLITLDHAEGGGFFPKCYGTETLGGSHGSGAVIWWHTTNRHWVHHLAIFDRDGSQGLHPKGGVIRAFDGSMIGTTQDGGEAGLGTVFRCTSAGELSVLHHFNPNAFEGFRPTQAPTAGPDGHYYGATESGGRDYAGALYRMAPDGTMTTLFSFQDRGQANGRYPHGPLALAPDGLFYGLTALGGRYDGGTLFSLSPAGDFHRLHDFTAYEGIEPMAGLLPLPDGTLYGTCSKGGVFGRGSVFKFHPQHRKLVVRHYFDESGEYGGTPMSALTLASNGYLYGTTRDGGFEGGGTMFRIAP